VEEFVILWFEREFRFRDALALELIASAHPVRLCVRCVATDEAMRSSFGPHVGCLMQDLSTAPNGRRDDLAFMTEVAASRSSCRMVVLTDDLTMTEAREAQGLGATTRPKRGCFEAIDVLARQILEPVVVRNAGLAKCGPRAEMSRLDAIEAERGRESSQRLAMEQALEMSTTVQEAADRLEWPRTTLITRMNKLGLVPRAGRKPDPP
jgi:hypothetical protein